MSISSESVPRNHQETLLLPQWKAAIDEEIVVLTARGTWELVIRPIEATIVTYRWVYTVKYKANSTVNRYKARLIVRGFTQTNGIDYEETFSLLPISTPSELFSPLP